MAYETIIQSQRYIGRRRKVYSAVLLKDGQNVAQMDGATKAEAKAAMIEAAQDALANGNAIRYLFCGDGKTVLVVRFAYGTWMYDICDAERVHPASVMLQYGNTLQTATKLAIDHAEQSYGGVKTKLG